MITRSSTLQGVVVGVLLMAAAGFAIGALAAGAARRAVERVWIARRASVVFTALGV